MTTETRNETRPEQRAVSAWQDGLKALFGGYDRQTEQLASGFWNLRLDPEQATGSMRRITDSTLAIVSAQLDVAREWLQAPYWATGLSSPRALQESYGRLAQAYGSLFTAYIGAAAPIQNAVTKATTSAAATAGAVVKTQVETARTVARDVAAAQQAANEVATQTARQVTTAGARVVEQAIEIAAEATTLPIKGNVSRDGQKIYHVQGQANYDRIEADALFTNEAEAVAAGYRPSLR